MKDLIESVYGNLVNDYRTIEPRLPLYLLDDRLFILIRIADTEFIVVCLQSLERFSISTLNKQLYMYQDRLDLPIAYGFSEISSYQRRRLVERGIPFVADNGQIYLPFLGSFFVRCSGSIPTMNNKFNATSQMLFLLFLYGDKMEYSKSSAAYRLRVSPMSITRASRHLAELGLISEERAGKEIYMISRYSSREEFYNSGEKYLINPIQEELFLPVPSTNDRYYSEESIGSLLRYRYGITNTERVIAGEYSLSLRTKLGYPMYREYALYKNAIGVRDLVGVDPDVFNPEELILLQKWRYDPYIFSDDRYMADPVSLICSLKQIDNERLQSSLDEVREEIEGWTLIR